MSPSLISIGISSTSTGIDSSSSDGSPSAIRLSILPISSSAVIVRLSIYSFAGVFSSRWRAMLLGDTDAVTRITGMSASAPFFAFWNSLKPALPGSSTPMISSAGASVAALARPSSPSANAATSIG